MHVQGFPRIYISVGTGSILHPGVYPEKPPRISVDLSPGGLSSLFEVVVKLNEEETEIESVQFFPVVKDLSA